MTVREITPETEGMLRSGYVTRQEGELAVLSRWFPAEAVGALAVAPYLDVILYSREQIRKENEVRALQRHPYSGHREPTLRSPIGHGEINRFQRSLGCCEC